LLIWQHWPRKHADSVIICPSPLALERLCAELRHQGRREVYRRLTNGLSADQRKRLDALIERRDETGQVWLTWLRQMPEAAKPTAMLGVIERLEHVRAVGIDPSRGHLIHQARLSQLAREADKPPFSMSPVSSGSVGMRRWWPSPWISPPA
jgi:hypothetical protein